MCAGITVWEPRQRWRVGPGVRLGVVGLGGLGHLAVKFGVALGAVANVEVVPASRAQEALDRLSRGEVRYRFVLDCAELGAS